MAPKARKSKYAEAGVDVKKRGIEVFKGTVENLFPNAFCVVVRDPFSPDHGLVTHTDGAGSKPVQSYLNWRETGDTAWFRGLAQDVLAMNLDDIICVGAEPVNFVDYVALNPFKVPKVELLRELNSGFRECLQTLRDHGVRVIFSGGETADQPDQVRTLDVSGTINGRVELTSVLSGERIKPGNLIIGLRSGGKTKYETRENSGIMCNGLTLARLCLISREYQAKYPEISAEERGYYGKYGPNDYLDELGMTVGEALTSPTRLYAPVVAKIMEEYRPYVTGLIHNTGGGQTKCLRVGRNIHYVKDDLPDVDPIFMLIQRESGEEWRAMYENYNMGVGFEVVAEKEAAEDILSVPERFNLEAKIIGRCERSVGPNKVTIRSPLGKFRYP
ncbi:MAG: phosphoribosylformylglycinamidine cyclo-ligase [Candidatus Bathyarchaeota archaeon B26-2]|nr:MAG: phosphoribosylformylglycinamidine cyclo-ligase [Candidatus Bathyarchaeota archaeon B26-2]